MLTDCACRAAALAAFAALAMTAATPKSLWANTQQGQQMVRNWAQADRCAASAQKQFPDFTPESLAKRDQALQQCLANSVLPPRAPQAPGQPAGQ
jgi:predicted DNA-binding WGR domain protein